MQMYQGQMSPSIALLHHNADILPPANWTCWHVPLQHQNADIPRWELNLMLQISTTPGEFDMLINPSGM